MSTKDKRGQVARLVLTFEVKLNNSASLRSNYNDVHHKNRQINAVKKVIAVYSGDHSKHAERTDSYFGGAWFESRPG